MVDYSITSLHKHPFGDVKLTQLRIYRAPDPNFLTWGWAQDYDQGGITPIGSVVTTATAVGQWSTVKAAQKGVVNGQSALKIRSALTTADHSTE